MSLRAMAVSGLAVAGLLLTVPAAQAATPSGPAHRGATGLPAAAALVLPVRLQDVEVGHLQLGPPPRARPGKHHLATFSCKTYIVKGLPRTGFGETATAASVVANSAQAYQQVVFQFASTKQATAFYRQLYAFTVRCRTVTASFHGTVRLTTQSLKKTHLGKLPAFLAKQTLSATGFGAPTINDTLATVSGRDVLFIDAAGHKVPSKPALRTAVQNLVTRILHFGPRVPA